MFIDTHAHIYSEEFDPDFEQMIERANISGVDQIFMPNIDSGTIDKMKAITKKYPFCHPLIGLHPCHVKENFREEIKIVEESLKEGGFVGVGEIGIDLYWDKTFVEEQIWAFRYQIELAKEANLPIVIHSRDSLDMTIQIVEELQDGKLTGIFHCFTGSRLQADKISSLGFKMGIGGVVTYKNAGLDKVIEDVSMDDIVLETDAPYLSPVPYRGKRNECAYLVNIATKISEIKKVSITEVAHKTTANALIIFKLHTKK